MDDDVITLACFNISEPVLFTKTKTIYSFVIELSINFFCLL